MSQSGKYFAGGGALVPIDTLTGNVGGPVGPDGAGNINIVGTNVIDVTGNPGTNTLTVEVIDSAAGNLIIGGGGPGPAWGTLTSLDGTITITGGMNTLNIGISNVLVYTLVTTTPYIVLSTDHYLAVDTTGMPITVELPDAPTNYQTWAIKDYLGNANTNNISVTTIGGVKTIDGMTTFLMNNDYQAIHVIYDGANYQIY